MGVMDEERQRANAEQEVMRMEADEAQLIDQLKSTQESQRYAYDDLEKALNYEVSWVIQKGLYCCTAETCLLLCNSTKLRNRWAQEIWLTDFVVCRKTKASLTVEFVDHVTCTADYIMCLWLPIFEDATYITVTDYK